MARKKPKVNIVLTRRERDILTLVAAGHTVDEIASDLDINRKTVENHLGTLMIRCGLFDVAAIVPYALEQGAIDLYEVLESRFSPLPGASRQDGTSRVRSGQRDTEI
jgi:DNA-binding CsgD family transcriptional regulator